MPDPIPWKYLKGRRLDLGEDIQTFADRCEPRIARPTLSRIEAGYSGGAPMILKAIADRLSMTVCDLIATRDGATSQSEQKVA